MTFGEVALSDAEGAVLAHSVAVPGGRLRKGTVLDGHAIAALRAAGLARVTVARLDAAEMPEDAAAEKLAAALVPDPGAAGLAARAAGTGRVNIVAQTAGIVDVRAGAIDAFNTVDPAITVATLAPFTRVEPGTMVATVKIIPYAAPAEAVTQAASAGRGALRVRAPVLDRADLVVTELEGGAADTGVRAVADRLARLGVAMTPPRRVAHDAGALAGTLADCAAPLVLVLTASATSDLHDTAPAALRRAGGQLDHFGMPVDPGNLLFTGRLGGHAVIGLPGCAKSPALNGADWVLERTVCGCPPEPAQIMRMGVGGLLKEIPTRPRPRRRGETGQPADSSA